MLKRISFFIFILFGSKTVVFAQELNCKVQVLSQQIQGTDKRVFETLQTALFEFMNNRKWTPDNFKNEERIDCSVLINITERPSTEEFKATIQVQSRRPIFKTSYNSTVLNFNDQDFQFKYLENQPLDFQDNLFVSNLTSVMAFYAYTIVGMDYDTYSLNGGTPYLQKALQIVNNAQSTPEPGWRAFESNRNRYWLINNMLDAPFINIRTCLYNYHLKGLDIMSDNKDGGRAIILESLLTLKSVHQTRPLSFSMQLFFNAKADEIINIFKGAYPDEKSKLITLLNDIDPTNSNKYQKIMATN